MRGSTGVIKLDCFSQMRFSGIELILVVERDPEIESGNWISGFQFHQRLESFGRLVHLAQLHVLNSELAQRYRKIRIRTDSLTEKLSGALHVPFLRRRGSFLIKSQ